QVIGEHGDSEVVLWSNANVGGVPLRRWHGWNNAYEAHIADEVKHAAHEIIRRKGATNHAIGLVTATLLRWALRDEHRVLTVSRAQTGAFGIEGVSLSLPCVVGQRGVLEVIEPDIDAQELAALHLSADALRSARGGVQP
ncbi:MAG: hypothetical protein RL701_7802, partial [Pseudomonadota bacterium]